MSNPTIRISQKAHLTLKELAARSGQPMQDILDQAIEEERRRRFIHDANSSYARVQANSELWSSLEAERDLWDETLLDGLNVDSSLKTTGKSRRKPSKPKKDGLVP
jgi:hypothetical protein